MTVVDKTQHFPLFELGPNGPTLNGKPIKACKAVKIEEPIEPGSVVVAVSFTIICRVVRKPGDKEAVDLNAAIDVSDMGSAELMIRDFIKPSDLP